VPNYAKINGDTILEFPSYPQQNHPQTSFGDGWQGEIDGVKYVIVEYVPYENTAPNKQVVYDELPQAVDGVWKLNYSLVNISLEQAKSNKLQNIEQEWLALEKTGWDSGQGYYLGITPSDVALLVGVFSLAKEAAALGLELPNLISMANTPISFTTIEEMTLLLLQYGQARSNMASSFAARRKAVADATTIEELGVI
jgi:hypothetical protein